MPLVLDQVDNIVLAKNDGSPYFNEVKRLRALAVGLHSLYLSVRAVEEEHAQPEGTRHYQWGNIPGVPLQQIECAFHWYSVSACNYGRLIGWIGHKEKVWKDPKGLIYVKNIMVPAYRYRNKVAAHFAQYQPHPKDSPAELTLSTMNLPALANGRFTVDGMSLHVRRGGVASSTSNTPWSLTDLHEQLQQRYGDEFQFLVTS